MSIATEMTFAEYAALPESNRIIAPPGVCLDDENSFGPDLFWIDADKRRCSRIRLDMIGEPRGAVFRRW